MKSSAILSQEKFAEGEIEGVLQCGGEFPEHIKSPLLMVTL